MKIMTWVNPGEESEKLHFPVSRVVSFQESPKFSYDDIQKGHVVPKTTYPLLISLECRGETRIWFKTLGDRDAWMQVLVDLMKSDA